MLFCSVCSLHGIIVTVVKYFLSALFSMRCLCAEVLLEQCDRCKGKTNGRLKFKWTTSTNKFIQDLKEPAGGSSLH